MRALLGLLALASLGCGGAADRDEPPPAGEGDLEPAAGPVDDEPSSGPTGEENHSLATARALVMDGPEATDTIGASDEVDYFTFDGSEGQWVSVSTWPSDGAFGGDTIVTLVDADGRVLGESDEAPRMVDDDRDARLVARLPTDGRYFVQVRDAGLPPEFFEMGAAGIGSFYVYRVGVASLVSGAGVAIADVDSDAGVDFVTQEAAGLEFGHAFLLGTLVDAADARVFSFDVPGGDDRAFVAELLPTRLVAADDTVARVSVRSEPAEEVIATVSPTDGRVMLSPSLHPGSFSVFVEGAAGAEVGAQFVVLAELSPENPLEQADVANDASEGAELLEFDESTRRAYLLSHLPDGDVDFYRIEHPSAAGLDVHCSSYQSGSGVVDLRVEVIDGAGGTIASMVEPSGGLLALEKIALDEPGPHYIRLSKLGQADGIAGDWARCVAYLE